MKLKMVAALVDDARTETVMETARDCGATGATVITSVRGEGLTPKKSFLGLSVTGQRDMVLFLVEAQRSQRILEAVAAAGRFVEEPGSGVAFVLDIEDAIGLDSQAEVLKREIEDEL